jgi:hypothetical protein
LHVAGDRTGDQQDVGVARRGDEADAESLQIVESVVERVDLEFTAVAGASIHFADGEAAAEPTVRRPVQALRQLRQTILVGSRCGFRQWSVEQAAENNLAHAQRS